MNFTITKEMIKNSLVNKGDVARIVEVIRKANREYRTKPYASVCP